MAVSTVSLFIKYLGICREWVFNYKSRSKCK